MSASGVWRTRANALTATRLVAAPVCAFAIANELHGIALGLFVLAVATDLVDGPVARRYGETSALGGLLDHASDATFVALGCLAVALRGELPWILSPLIAAAFVQYVLDSRTPVRSAPPRASWALRASSLGRWNGIGYFVALGIPVVHDLPGVGANLIDHYVIRVVHRVHGTETVNEIARFPRVLPEILRFAFTGKGALTFGVTTAQVFCDSREG
ncbi:MAG: CDP-alcohol phosphatidyltransferase family protein, partial [Candidatus Poseidoniia archaeon]